MILVWLAFGSVALAQSSLDMSQDLVRLGIASLNMVPNQPDLDAGPLLLGIVNFAQTHRIARVIADQGAYYFRSMQTPNAHVGWNQLNNLTIDLQGSDLYFAFPLQNGLAINNSTNIVLQNFTAETNVTTAVAILNPTSIATTVAITVSDDTGRVIGTSSVNLAANNKTALFLRTLAGLEGMVGRRGTAQFTVTAGSVAVLGLRFDGPAFTSIPTQQN
jgi:hypothetical protein